MTAYDLSADELAEVLLRGASGRDTCEASIRLLVAHGVWPVRLAAAEFVELSDEDEPEEPRYAWVGWRHAVAALEAGTLTGGSGSDNRVLRIAASLSELGVPVDLADAVTGLDRHNLALVLARTSTRTTPPQPCLGAGRPVARQRLARAQGLRRQAARGRQPTCRHH